MQRKQPPVVYAAFDRLGTAEEAIASLLSQGVRPRELSVAGNGIYVNMEEMPGGQASAMFVGRGSGDIRPDVEALELTREINDRPFAPPEIEEDESEFEDLDIPVGFVEMPTLSGDAGLTTLAVQGFGVMVGDGPMARALAKRGFDAARRENLRTVLRGYLEENGLKSPEAASLAGYTDRGALVEVQVRTPLALRLMEDDLRAHEAAQVVSRRPQ
jgi:hypothetical protein